ncbi:MAG: redoxin domain-containing protein [Saprospiraceae bacterium]|nr:redoxin domain-containing protein [Saprospiraceae bacterium]
MKQFLTLLCFLAHSVLFSTPAPNFTVTSSDNQTLKLYENYINQGKLVVIEAFFTTCPPCNTHAPHVQTLYNQMLAQYPGKVEFILLSTLGSDTNVKVAQYKTSKGLTMPGVGADGGSQTALQPYTNGTFGDFLGTPTFIVIAPNTGEVHFDIRGNSATQTMALLSEKIAELQPAPPCTVQNFFGSGLDEVDLHIYNEFFDTTFMINGPYSLKGNPLFAGQSYTIKPTKDYNPLEGLTTYDLVLISKHILGIEALNCSWQRVAADVNCSGSITTFDIVTARKAILGILPSLPCGSWRFLPDSLTAFGGACQNFTAVKIGDVNGYACDEATSAADTRSVLPLSPTNTYLEQGETRDIDVYLSENLTLEGLQLAFEFNPDQLKINHISSETLNQFDEDTYNLDRQGFVPLAWLNPTGSQVEAEKPLLSLQVTAVQSGRLSDMLKLRSAGTFQPEAYVNNSTIRGLQLNWLESTEFVQVTPNPADQTCELAFYLSDESPAIVQIFNFQGRLMSQTQDQGVVGLNKKTLHVGQWQRGAYQVILNGKRAGSFLVLHQ